MIGEKNKGGRPSEYHSGLVDVINNLADQGGANIAQMCRACKIASFATFYKYKKEHPEFDTATEQCKMASAATLEEALMLGATGVRKIDSKAAMWMLYCKDQDQYKMPGRPSLNETAGKSVNIQIGNINMATLNQLSADELDRMVKATEQSIRSIEASQLPELKTLEH